jgi:hypothetical protein
MLTLRAIAAIALAGMLAGCAEQDPSARQARRDRRIPITPPKEVAAEIVAIEPVESAGAAGQPATSAAPRPLEKLAPTAGVPRTRPAVVAKTAPLMPVTRAKRAEAQPPGTQPAAATLPAKVAEPVKVLGRSELVEGAIVQVNSRFLTAEDVLRAACFELDEIPSNLPEQAFRARVEKVLRAELHRQVTQAMVLPEAEKLLTEEQKKQIDAEIDHTLREMIARADGSRKKLEENLASVGATVQAVLEGQRNRLTVQTFLRWKFAPSVQVSRRMLWDYYCANRRDFSSPAKVAMQIVAVPMGAFLSAGESRPSVAELEIARAKARQRIEQAQKAIKQGEDFVLVADRFSSGPGNPPDGVWPLMPAGNFRQEAVEAAAFKLPEGGVSSIIETDTGFYIVKARQVQPGSTTPFEDAQAEIERILRERQSSKLYDEYYLPLMKGATIVQPENFLPLATDQAVQRFWRKGGGPATQQVPSRPGR